MMKKLLVGLLLLSVLLSLASCGSRPFSYVEPSEEIVAMELVSAKSSLDYTVTKTLFGTERMDLMKRLQQTEFHKCLSAPPDLSGNAIKITYLSGAYEMIGLGTVEYVKNNEIMYRWIACDDAVFQELFNRYAG